MKGVSRRGFLKSVGIGAGVMVGTRVAGRSLIGTALAATPKPTSVVCVFLNGGINAIFTGADAFNNAFGVTQDNVMALGPVVIDNTLANAIPENLRSHVASVGIRHGLSDHGGAQQALFMNGNQSAPLVLAGAIGGSSAIKAAVVGNGTLPNGVRPAPVNGVSLQSITDMRATIDAIAGAQSAPNVADRDGAAKGIACAQGMSSAALSKNPKSLTSLDQGLKAAIETMKKPVQLFREDEFRSAYGLDDTAVNSFAAKMAAAELMVRSGSGVVIAEDNGSWDSHGDRSGARVRNQMTERIQPGLRTFLSRVVADEQGIRNVIVAIFGDFHRSLPGSDHASAVSALMIGPASRTRRREKPTGMCLCPPIPPESTGFGNFCPQRPRSILNRSARTPTPHYWPDMSPNGDDRLDAWCGNFDKNRRGELWEECREYRERGDVGSFCGWCSRAPVSPRLSSG